MKLRFLGVAREELHAVAATYEALRPGLGLRFLRASTAAIECARAFPSAGAVARGEVRRIEVRSFPKAVLYGVDGDTIVVLAVAHEPRRPDDQADAG